jgi:hypothetical protein
VRLGLGLLETQGKIVLRHGLRGTMCPGFHWDPAYAAHDNLQRALAYTLSTIRPFDVFNLVRTYWT